MQEQNDIRQVLRQALEALNSKENKSRYFDLHDDALITHGIPANFTTNISLLWEKVSKLGIILITFPSCLTTLVE
jgi:hypothetical protein